MTTVADLLLDRAERTRPRSSTRTARGPTASSSTRAGAEPRCSPSCAIPTGRRTSACCSTTCPTTCSGWWPARCPAPSWSASTRPTAASSWRSSIDHTDCQALVTSSDLRRAARRRRHAVPAERVLVVDDPDYDKRARRRTVDRRRRRPTPTDDDLYLLIFTSGSTGLPKAVRCTQGRIGRTGAHVAGIAELDRRRRRLRAAAVLPRRLAVHRLGVGGERRASRSRPGRGSRRRARSPDIRRFGATFLTYTGKVLNYMLSVPEPPDDADIPLRLAIGNEASEHDIREFARRFGCHVRDSYGSTEGVIIIRRDPSMPAGALGTADDSVKVLDPETGEECPPARLRRPGGSTNLDEAVGEIVETQPTIGLRGLLPQRGRHQRAVPRRRLLVRRPRLPRRRRLALLRRPLERLAARRRRELRRRARRGDHRPPPRRPLGRRLRRARRPGRRSGDGRARAAATATFDGSRSTSSSPTSPTSARSGSRRSSG